MEFYDLLLWPLNASNFTTCFFRPAVPRINGPRSVTAPNRRIRAFDGNRINLFIVHREWCTRKLLSRSVDTPEPRFTRTAIPRGFVLREWKSHESVPRGFVSRDWKSRKQMLLVQEKSNYWKEMLAWVLEILYTFISHGQTKEIIISFQRTKVHFIRCC